jgi:hypothetical protein
LGNNMAVWWSLHQNFQLRCTWHNRRHRAHLVKVRTLTSPDPSGQIFLFSRKWFTTVNHSRHIYQQRGFAKPKVGHKWKWDCVICTINVLLLYEFYMSFQWKWFGCNSHCCMSLIIKYVPKLILDVNKNEWHYKIGIEHLKQSYI